MQLKFFHSFPDVLQGDKFEHAIFTVIASANKHLPNSSYIIIKRNFW